MHLFFPLKFPSPLPELNTKRKPYTTYKQQVCLFGGAFQYFRCSPQMWQANGMSLGIIVTHFACMAQRLASSMRLTKYASAASCRHIMLLPWKHRLYLPTSRAISQTSHEKGSILIRSLVLFWKCQISQRATVPGQYFLVFLTLPAQRNSFQGALPPMVGQSFLWTGSSPQSRWPSLCSHLGQPLGWQ